MLHYIRKQLIQSFILNVSLTNGARWNESDSTGNSWSTFLSVYKSCVTAKKHEIIFWITLLKNGVILKSSTLKQVFFRLKIYFESNEE